tara:strand:+ start:667 stop:2043 length:1377 start_codon:yes stop_codon:yes gene_type:complete
MNSKNKYFNNTERLFGTDGIRGKVNGEKINALMAVNIAMAAGEYFYGKAGTKRPRVLIGKDTRLSGYMLEPALVAGFTSLGIDSITTGPLPTPGIAHLTNVLRCDLGVMISASHNPYQDNGIKLFNADGYKLSDDVENKIQSLLKKGPRLSNSENLGRARRMEDAIGRYIEFIKSILDKNEDLSGIKVVLDCANGAGYKVGPEAMFELGCDVISMSISPDGKNINDKCGAIFPKKMAEMTYKSKANIGIALDGDADRVIFSDEKGELIDGDQIIGVLANNMKTSNQLNNNTVVGTIMTNLSLEQYLNSLGINLNRVNVGDRYILDEMINNDYNLGGEPSGHVLLTNHSKTGDGLLTAIKVISLLKKSGLQASEFLRPFKMTPYKIKNINQLDNKILDNSIVKNKIKDFNKQLSDNGRILVRPSGTESLIRILVESKEKSLIDKYLTKVSEILDQNIKK